jgi:hypothetical protein
VLKYMAEKPEEALAPDSTTMIPAGSAA